MSECECFGDCDFQLAGISLNVAKAGEWQTTVVFKLDNPARVSRSLTHRHFSANVQLTT